MPISFFITLIPIFTLFCLSRASHRYTVKDLKETFPNAVLRPVSAAQFKQAKSGYIGPGQVLFDHTSKDLVLASADDLKKQEKKLKTVSVDSMNKKIYCRQEDSLARRLCEDKLAEIDSIYKAGKKDTVRMDPRTEGYIMGFAEDMTKTGTDWDEFATVLYVAVGVVVVAALIITGGKIVYDIIMKHERFDLWKEAGVRYGYSGNHIKEEEGAGYYGNSHFLGGRFSMGLTRRYLGLGVTAETGYVNLTVENEYNPLEFFNSRGMYWLFGPLVRYTTRQSVSWNLELLNGTSNRRSVGWISKARCFAQVDVNRYLFWGLHLGALFVDLRELEGLLIQDGDFNDKFSMLFGIETGVRF
ncbi:hypothetical protein ACFL5V_03940 [Fibrobacterota bacterium]